MEKASVCEKTIAYGRQRWRVSGGHWQVLMFGSHGPNDPQRGLSWKWHDISKERVPHEVKRLA